MIMPLLIGGLGNIIVPIQLAAPDMIFPRLNNLSLWFLPLALLEVTSSIIIDSGLGAGWTLYAPLSVISSGLDMLVFGIHLAGLSSLVGAMNFIGTTLRMRWTIEPYYYWFSIPFFSLAIFTTAWLLVLTIPVLAAAVTMLLLDRHFNSCFYDP